MVELNEHLWKSDHIALVCTNFIYCIICIFIAPLLFLFINCHFSGMQCSEPTHWMIYSSNFIRILWSITLFLSFTPSGKHHPWIIIQNGEENRIKNPFETMNTISWFITLHSAAVLSMVSQFPHTSCGTYFSWVYW